jgi:hypothetical protein
VVLVLAFASCSGAVASHPRPTTGGITGIAYNRATGYAIAGAQVRAVLPPHLPILAVSAAGGLFDLAGLAPGSYTLRGEFAHQVVEVAGIDVSAGEVTLAKLPFSSAGSAGDTAGSAQTVSVDSSALTEITRYHRDDLAGAARVEGFVIDAATHVAVAGAIITVSMVANANATQQSSSDDRGAFHFDGLAPGTYTLSAYYSLAHRGQIEVRRSDIAVAAAEVVVVPLVVDTAR